MVLISFASGAADAGSEVPVLALCGDGGFLHGGFSGLVNAVFNKSNLVILLLDNSTLGNTGLAIYRLYRQKYRG